MSNSSRTLSVPEFLRRSTLGPDGNPFLETIRKPIFNAWSVDTCSRHQSNYKLVSGPKQLHQHTVSATGGALSLELLIRRQIITNHLSEINEDMLRRLEWYGRGKKLWEDILACGEDSWKVFSKFCEVYGHERDFKAMLENDGAKISPELREQQHSHPMFNKTHGGQYPVYPPPTGAEIRYRTQVIKDPLPPWESSIPLLTAPIPKLNNGDFSWLVCFQLCADSFQGQPWSSRDLQYALGELPNLAVLSIQGSLSNNGPPRIVRDGYIYDWARQARNGKWGSLRILILEEKLDALMDTFRPPARHHTELKRVPPPSPPPPRRGLFGELDSFPKLSVVSFSLPAPPQGWGVYDSNCGAIQEGYSSLPPLQTRYPLFDYVRAKDLFAEGDKKGWFSERIRDFTGTLKDRPRCVKDLVRAAGFSNIRKLAQAVAVLVECEKKEKEQMQNEGAMAKRTAALESKMSKLMGRKAPNKHENTQQNLNQETQELNHSQTIPLTSPIMVNVIFDTNLVPNPPHLKALPQKTAFTGRTSPTDQQSLSNRRIIFEKKRTVVLTPPQTYSAPFSPSGSPTNGVNKKRKESGDGRYHRETWGFNGSEEPDWDEEEEEGEENEEDDEWYDVSSGDSSKDENEEMNMDGKIHSQPAANGTGTGTHKKLRLAKENDAKDMSDLLAEFTYY